MIKVVQILIRATWLVAFMLGIILWTSSSRTLVPVHQFLGAAFVLMLWVLAHVAWHSGAAPGLAAAAFGWSLIVLVLGFTQTRILPGSSHWAIQTLHVLVGVAAIGLAEALGARMKRRTGGPG